MAAITVTDNLDGTATVIVSGTLGGAWTLRASAWQGVTGLMPFVTQAGGTGDQTLAAVTPTMVSGPILWTLRLTATGVSTDPTYQPIARTGTAPHLMAANFICDGLQLIGLTGIATADIFVRRIPKSVGKETDRNHCIVSPFPAESEVQEISGKDDVIYPVTVAWFSPNDGDLNQNMTRDFGWRWRAARAFRNHRPDGIPGAAPLQIKWRPDVPTSVSLATGMNLSVGVMVFEVGYRETRATV